MSKTARRKHTMGPRVVATFTVSVFLAWAASPAFALLNFNKAFTARYVDTDAETPAQETLSAAVKEARCNVCHAGTSKKDRNSYGQLLDVLLDKETDKDDAAKIEKALKVVERINSDLMDPESPTYGDLLRQGKLWQPEGE